MNLEGNLFLAVTASDLSGGSGQPNVQTLRGHVLELDPEGPEVHGVSSTVLVADSEWFVTNSASLTVLSTAGPTIRVLASFVERIAITPSWLWRTLVVVLSYNKTTRQVAMGEPAVIAAGYATVWNHSIWVQSPSRAVLFHQYGRVVLAIAGTTISVTSTISDVLGGPQRVYPVNEHALVAYREGGALMMGQVDGNGAVVASDVVAPATSRWVRVQVVMSDRSDAQRPEFARVGVVRTDDNGVPLARRPVTVSRFVWDLQANAIEWIGDPSNSPPDPWHGDSDTTFQSTTFTMAEVTDGLMPDGFVVDALVFPDDYQPDLMDTLVNADQVIVGLRNFIYVTTDPTPGIDGSQVMPGDFFRELEPLSAAVFAPDEPVEKPVDFSPAVDLAFLNWPAPPHHVSWQTTFGHDVESSNQMSLNADGSGGVAVTATHYLVTRRVGNQYEDLQTISGEVHPFRVGQTRGPTEIIRTSQRVAR